MNNELFLRIAYLVFYSLFYYIRYQMYNYFVNSIGGYFRLSWVRYISPYLMCD